jgi:hypothetical protein
MDAVLYVECEKRKENFDYQGELSEEEYVKMLREASDSILGSDGFSKRSTTEKRYGIYDASEMYKYTFNNQDDFEELPFKVKLFDMNNNDLTMEHISYFWRNNSPFIIIVELEEIDNPLVEDTLNIWLTNSDHTNNDDTLNESLILKTLKPKDFRTKINNVGFKLKFCKMVNKINANKFALLVNNIER